MKKVFLTLVYASALLLSCSEESSVNLNENTSEVNTKSGEPDLNSLYKEMIASDEYIDLSIASMNFVNKLNSDQISSFETEEDLLEWGELNIATTKFNDYNDFLNEWGNLNIKQELVINKHGLFYSGVGSAYPNVNIDFPQNPPTEVDGCGCQAGLSTCEKAAHDTYIIESTVVWLFSTNIKNGLTLAKVNLDIANNACYNTYTGCLKSCTE